MRGTSALLGLLLASVARHAAAGGSIQDQAVTLEYLPVHWGTTAAADLLGAWPSGDPLRATGFWYRVVGVDDRERPLPLPDQEHYANGEALVRWENVDGKGFSAAESTAVFDNERPSATLSSRLSLTNLTSAPLELRVFHYLDVDVPGNADDDRAQGLTRTYLKFSDLAGSAIRYRGEGADKFQVGSFPLLRDALSDSTATELTNGGVPYGPGNATAAYQWNVTIPPGGQRSVWVSVSFRGLLDHVKGDLGPLYTGSSPLLLREIVPEFPPYDLVQWHMRRTAYWTEIGRILDPARRLVGVDDFDGDYVSDRVEHDASTGITYVHGDPVTGALPAPWHWRIAATGDFDADGRPDIVWRSLLTQKIVIWRMNDTARLGDIVPEPDQAADANWAIVAALDFNADGHRDLLWYNATSGKAVLWYMDAQVRRTTGAFTSPSNAGNNNWKIVAAGDYGKGLATEGTPVWGAPDIVWRNATSGRLVVWHMNSAGQRTSGVFVTLPASADPLNLEVVGPR